ncbi:MAG: DNA internalization-related competence protein ComEC/Rec2 [Coriobacteriales bacterium]|jgi:competence protein ComEC|nr:DNA internalization-related competence protein ComEC/Rec2 [Coriobacteriales bacterium]
MTTGAERVMRAAALDGADELGEPAVDKVIRPSLPKLLVPLGALWLGLLTSEHLVWNSLLMPWLPLLLALVGFALLAVVAARQRFLRSAQGIPTLLALLLALLLGCGFWSFQGAQANSLGAEAGNALTLRILDDPSTGAFSQTSLARVSLPAGGSVKVRILWGQGSEPLPPGTVVMARFDLVNLTEYQQFLHRQGVVASVKLSDVHVLGFQHDLIGLIAGFREENRQLILQHEGEGAALLCGVLLGDTTGLDASSVGRDFRVTGLTHLIAVSGSHLIVVATLIGYFLRRLKLDYRVEIILIVGLLAAYVILTGLQPSAIRACIMTFVANLARIVGRRNHAPSALTAAAVGMLLVYPPAAFSLGFWLSVFAVFGLALFCPLVCAHLSALFSRETRAGEKAGKKGRMRSLLLEPIGMTLTAQLATIPLTAPVFAMLSIVSPLANLLVTPFITLMVGAGIIALIIAPVLPVIGVPLLGLLCILGDVSAYLARMLASLPYASAPIAWALIPTCCAFLVLATIVYLRWPQPSRRTSRRCLSVLAAGCGVFLVIALLPAQPQLIMMDIGQGDALLVRNKGSCVLIDTGSDEATLMKALGRNRVARLDAVIITHLDADHCGALEVLSGSIPVDHIYFADGLLSAQPDLAAFKEAARVVGEGRVESITYGDTLSLGGSVMLEVLFPLTSVSVGGNDESICLALIYDEDGDGQAEMRLLLTGDAEAPELEQFLAGEDEASYLVLKVGHHGSRDAVTPEQLDSMGCRVALISVGENNHYGHPTPETLGILEDAGVTVYRTDLNGDVRVYFGADAVRVVCDTMDSAFTSR